MKPGAMPGSAPSETGQTGRILVRGFPRQGSSGLAMALAEAGQPYSAGYAKRTRNFGIAPKS